VFGDALQVVEGEYEQGGAGGVLPGGWVEAHWVSRFLLKKKKTDDLCLIRILQKHIKRQIISLSGGFQVIADLNAYHTFISSLRVRVSHCVLV